MTWTPTVNRFQAVLHKDGAIEFNYDEVHAEDAIVGIYPMVTQDNEKEIGAIVAGQNATEEKAPAHPRYRAREAGPAVDGLFLKVSLETRGPVPPESDPAMMGVAYRVCLDPHRSLWATARRAAVRCVDCAGRGRARGRFGAAPRYGAFGAGVQPTVTVSGNTISMAGYAAGWLQGWR